jgi:serine/threonine protein kinase
MPLESGAVFAGFVIDRPLGSGAMGEVYLARHPRLPRNDALKVLPAALTGDAEFRRRFEREADLAATLWHQHIVAIHDRGEFEGQLWISMDYVEGTDAGRLLSESYPTGMPVGEVSEIVTAVADALDFAHDRQLLHRDVKPGNILLTASTSHRRRIFLADFGIARQADEVTGLTGTNMTVGSVGYAAPEQLMGERLDGRADQYGLAATAFRLLTGKMPFEHSNPTVVISKQLTAAAPRLSQYRADLSNLDRPLAMALAKDPNQRFPRCLDFAEALRQEHTRPYIRPVATPGDSTRLLDLPQSTKSTPDVTRAINLAPTAAPTPEPSGQQTAAEVQQEQSPTPPGAPAERSGNLLADPRWADALSAFFAERWDDAAARFEALQASYPGEGRVETRLKEARRQRDIDNWSRKAEVSTAAGDWDTVVTALENLTALDPAYPGVGARLEQARVAQRRKGLVDEMTALHQAGQWSAVLAAARELARIDPHNSDVAGIVSDVQAKIREAELPDRYAQALNHLDQGHWSQAADLLASIEQERPGYRDADTLLKMARQKLSKTTEFARQTTPPARPLPQTAEQAPPKTTTPPASVAARRVWRGWLVAAVVVIGVLLVGGLMILAAVKSSKSSNTSTPTSTSASTATTSPPSTSAQASGPNETISDYIKKNNIEKTAISRGTAGAPTIDLPVPVGWTRIPEGADAPYGGIVFDTPTTPNDPPKVIATVEKLTGNVDTDKLLAVAPGEVENLPGYSGDGGQDKVGGYPAYQLGGAYIKNGVTRVVAQNTVVIQSRDGIYVLQLHAEGPEVDAEALKSATVVVGQQTTITP